MAHLGWMGRAPGNLKDQRHENRWRCCSVAVRPFEATSSDVCTRSRRTAAAEVASFQLAWKEYQLLLAENVELRKLVDTEEAKVLAD